MANTVVLDACKYTLKDGDVSYGYKMYDDYYMGYDNNAEAEIMELSDFDLIKVAIDNPCQVSDDLFSYMKEEKEGITVNGTYYEWDEVSHLF